MLINTLVSVIYTVGAILDGQGPAVTMHLCTTTTRCGELNQRGNTRHSSISHDIDNPVRDEMITLCYWYLPVIGYKAPVFWLLV